MAPAPTVQGRSAALAGCAVPSACTCCIMRHAFPNSLVVTSIGGTSEPAIRPWTKASFPLSGLVKTPGRGGLTAIAKRVFERRTSLRLRQMPSSRIRIGPDKQRITGGCQCGAVRYTIGRLGKASICHCRMCQKAFGSFFAPLVEAHEVVWTREARTIFRSSKTNWRGFCKACGTPLTYEFDGVLEISIGSLDNPDLACPEVQVNATYRRACVRDLAHLPEKSAADKRLDDVWNASVVSFQHPDHDS